MSLTLFFNFSSLFQEILSLFYAVTNQLFKNSQNFEIHKESSCQSTFILVSTSESFIKKFSFYQKVLEQKRNLTKLKSQSNVTFLSLISLC